MNVDTMGKMASSHTIASADPPRVNPASLRVEDVARLLTTVGQLRITPAQVQADIDAGAPTNGDGTINLLHFTAWLASMMARGEAVLGNEYIPS